MEANFPITSHGVLCFHWSQFCDFSLVHFFGFLDSESDGAAEILHQNFRLFNFSGVHFTSYHWTEGHLAPQLLSNGQGQGSLKRIYVLKTAIFTLSEYNQSNNQSFNISASKSRKQCFKNKQFNKYMIHILQISMLEISRFNSICCIKKEHKDWILASKILKTSLIDRLLHSDWLLYICSLPFLSLGVQLGAWLGRPSSWIWSTPPQHQLPKK